MLRIHYSSRFTIYQNLFAKWFKLLSHRFDLVEKCKENFCFMNNFRMRMRRLLFYRKLRRRNRTMRMQEGVPGASLWCLQFWIFRLPWLQTLRVLLEWNKGIPLWSKGWRLPVQTELYGKILWSLCRWILRYSQLFA